MISDSNSFDLTSTTPKLVIGIMSGTSLDGVDASLVDFSDNKITILASHHIDYPQSLVDQLLQLNTPVCGELEQSALLAIEVARQYAHCVHGLLAKKQLSAGEIRLLACHGQTVRHRPERGFTIQLLNAAWLAELMGIAVAADFRSRDLAVDGQGAPLAPAFHQAFFGPKAQSCAVINLGGIANITHIEAGVVQRGFDCGPASILLDAWCQRHTGQHFDQDGAWARSGQPIESLLNRMLEQAFFALPPPKSCGREEFSIDMLLSFLNGKESPVNVQATLLELTAKSISDALVRWAPTAQQAIVCGGGAKNRYLMERLQNLLVPSSITLRHCEEFAIATDEVEACAFAWLGWRLLTRQSGNLPCVTGAKAERILGCIYPA